MAKKTARKPAKKLTRKPKARKPAKKTVSRAKAKKAVRKTKPAIKITKKPARMTAAKKELNRRLSAKQKAIEKKTVKTVAKLAKFDLEDHEIDRIVRDLEDIIKHFENLQKMAIKNLEATLHPVGKKNVTRHDRVRKGLTRKQAMAHTKRKEGKHFKGPKVA